MKALKWIGIGVGGLAAIAGGIVILVFALTSGAVNSANRLLALVGQGRYEDAYRAAAPQFRAETGLERFQATMKRYDIDKFQSASWTSREIANGKTRLEGTIRTRDGGSIPAVVVLVEAEGGWRVYAMEFRGAGLRVAEGGTHASPDPPDRAAMARLVGNSLASFGDAVKRADFAAFHATLAAPFRQQFGPERLKAEFRTFVENRIDLAPIRSVEPVFTAGPALGADGKLTMAGHYPTRPSQVHFDLIYVHEAGAWRLLALNVRVAPAP